MASSILAKMAVQITANNAQFLTSLNETNKRLGSFQTGLKSISSALGITFGARAVFDGIKYGLGVIAGFEASMSEVRAITQASGKEFEALKKDALGLGAATKYTAQQVSQLQVAYGRLGFTTKEILAATKATLTLATATGEDLAKSADVAGSTVRAFGLDASETQKVVDVMAASFNMSALGLENFSEAMKYVAPVAANANISIEQTTALLGVLADAGIRGSQAGTSLRKIISDLGQGAGPILTKRLKELAAAGLSGADAMNEVGRTAYASLLVLAKNTDKVDEATEAYRNSAGEASKMAAIMGDNLTGSVTRLSSAWDGLILSFSKTGGAAHLAADGLTRVVNALNSDKTGLTENLKDLSINKIAEEIKDGGVLAKINLDDIKKSLDDGSRSAKLYFNSVRDIVYASGQPIDENGVPALAEKYKLNATQADRLLKIIKELNSEVNEKNLRAQNAALIPNFDVDPQTGLPANGQGGKAFTGPEIKEKTIRDVDFLRAAISALNDSIGGLSSRGDIKTAQDEIKKLELELNNLLGVTEKVKKIEFKDFGDALRSFGNVRTPEFLTKQIKELNDQLLFNADPTKVSGIKKQITDVEAEYDRLSEGISVKKPNWDKFVKNFKLPEGYKEKIKENFNLDLSGTVGSAITDIGQAFGEFFADLGQGVDKMEPIGNRLKRVLGGFLSSIGSALIAYGTAKLVLENLSINPAVAIAAGVALVAAGAVLGRSANNVKKGLTGGGSGSSGGGATTSGRIDDFKQQELNIKITGEFEIAGDTLRASIKKGDYITGRRG